MRARNSRPRLDSLFNNPQGDDLAKSPHMARIGGSVYSDVKAEDFYQTQAGPSPMMKASLIYNLVNFRLDPSVILLVLVVVFAHQ